MQAIVLVGGEGTRLRPLTLSVPKPALTLVDRPFLAYMVEWLAGHGVSEVVLACGFLPDVLREALGDGEGEGTRIRYVVEPEARGTAGAIRFAAEQLGEDLEDRFLALNGDVLTDLDLTALLGAHTERGARATLGLHPVEDSSAYGLVSTGLGGEVLEFLEKTGEAAPGEINAGMYVLERSVLDLIPAGREVSIEREVFPRLVGGGLHGLRLDGYWMDIGTPDRYLAGELGHPRGAGGDAGGADRARPAGRCRRDGGRGRDGGAARRRRTGMPGEGPSGGPRLGAARRLHGGRGGSGERLDPRPRCRGRARRRARRRGDRRA